MISPFAANDIMDHDRQEDAGAGAGTETPTPRVFHVSSSNPVSTLMNSSRRCPCQPTSHHNPSKPSKQNRHHTSSNHRLSLFLLICLFALNCSAHLISLTGATTIEEQMVEEGEEVPDSTPREQLLPLDDDLLGSALARLAKTGTIIVDQRPPPVPPTQQNWDLEDLQDAINLRMRVRKRAEKRATSTKATATSLSTSTVTSSTVASTLLVAATETATALPTPFDSGFSNNITQSCATFVNGFLNNSTFQTCLPFSLLLQVRYLCSPFFTQY